MAIPSSIRRQRNFVAGQVSPDAERRSDLDIFDAGLKRARNVRALDTGALGRRPGRKVLYFDGGQHDLVRPISPTIFDVTFDAGRFTARLQNGGVVSNITGCPWTAAILPTISWQAVGKRIFVTARGMQPQYLEYDDATGVWSLNTFTFRTGVAGRVMVPFYRFAAFGVTMSPSALTGSITLTASAAVFEAGHVGVHFTYMDRELLITAVAGGGLSATATVIEDLPPTFRLKLDNVDGFSVGETVEGEDSNTVGEITSVDARRKHVYVTVSNNYSGFDVAGKEYIVADEGRGKLSAQSANTTHRAILQWKEQFMSAHRGWPGSVSFDAQRLILCDFPQIEEAVIWSAIDAPDDIDTASSAADAAIFTYVPRTCRVYQVIGGADQFVLTDAGCFYVPISESAPLTQANARFRPITSNAAANIRAVLAEDSVIFVGSELNRLFALYPTGQNTAPYKVVSLTDFHAELFSGPVSIAVADGSDAAPGRHIYVVNDDGMMIVGRYRQGEDFVGWFPWDSTGLVTAVAARFGSVIVAVTYSAGNTVEALDDTKKLDGTIELSDFSGNDVIALSTGEAIGTSTGEEIVTESGALIPFAGTTMYGWADGFYLGEIPVDAEGRVDFPTGYTDREVGWLFTPEVEPFVPTFEGGEDFGQAARKRKVSRVIVTVRDTQTFIADGHEFSHQFASYQIGDEMGGPRPARNDTYRYRQLGRSFDPRVNIRQPIPGGFTLVELSVQVTI